MRLSSLEAKSWLFTYCVYILKKGAKSMNKSPILVEFVQSFETRSERFLCVSCVMCVCVCVCTWWVRCVSAMCDVCVCVNVCACVSRLILHAYIIIIICIRVLNDLHTFYTLTHKRTHTHTHTFRKRVLKPRMRLMLENCVCVCVCTCARACERKRTERVERETEQQPSECACVYI